VDRRRGGDAHHGCDAVDARRHQRTRGAERVAPLDARADRTASGEAHRQRTERAREHPKATAQSTLADTLPASVATAIVGRLGIDGNVLLAHFSRDDRRRLVHALVEWPLPVAGTRGYNYAEVTAGGVALDEIDPSTMASRVCRGLYLVGEILDVDGRIGGFNFQWSWSTGFVAGRALASGAARA